MDCGLYSLEESLSGATLFKYQVVIVTERLPFEYMYQVLVLLYETTLRVYQVVCFPLYPFLKKKNKYKRIGDSPLAVFLCFKV